MATPGRTHEGRTHEHSREAALETELLDRLERQVAELTELKARVKSLEGALAAERKTRGEMAQRLTAERDRVRQLQSDMQSLGTDEEEVARLREELATERQSAIALGSQLEQAWTQLNDMKLEMGQGRGPFRRKRG
jgi:predicted RNase H-like nuclease (RuvC/YqgF family)